MKHIITTLITILTLVCTSHFITAQCTGTLGVVADFEDGDPLASGWETICQGPGNCNSGPGKGFHIKPANFGSFSLLTDGPNNATYYLEQCFDLSGHTAYKIEFNCGISTVESLKLEYSLDGTNYIQFWANPDLEEPQSSNIPIAGESQVYLRFVGEEKGIELDDIMVSVASIDLCYGYDLAGNRTSADLIVGLVSDDSEVAHISPADVPMQSYSAMTTEGGEVIISDDILSKTDFKVFPNPARNILNLVSTDNAATNPIQVYDEAGRLVHETQLKGSLELRVTDWLSGTYFVYILSGDEKIIYKVIKI